MLLEEVASWNQGTSTRTTRGLSLWAGSASVPRQTVREGAWAVGTQPETLEGMALGTQQGGPCGECSDVILVLQERQPLWK